MNDDTAGREKVFKAFRASSEYQALKAEIDAAQSDESMEVTVRVPKSLPRVFEILSKHTDEGSFEEFLSVEIRRAESRLVSILLQHTTYFPEFQAVYNRVCDEEGHPELRE